MRIPDGPIFYKFLRRGEAFSATFVPFAQRVHSLLARLNPAASVQTEPALTTSGGQKISLRIESTRGTESWGLVSYPADIPHFKITFWRGSVDANALANRIDGRYVSEMLKQDLADVSYGMQNATGIRSIFDRLVLRGATIGRISYLYAFHKIQMIPDLSGALNSHSRTEGIGFSTFVESIEKEVPRLRSFEMVTCRRASLGAFLKQWDDDLVATFGRDAFESVLAPIGVDLDTWLGR